MRQFDQTVCRDLEVACRREWLETNGIGGFASSTITGLNTRRYHGLLTAATKPPVGRMVLLSKLEETVVVNGRRVELSVNRYPCVVHPKGYLHLKQFRQDPFPAFVYEAEGVELVKSVFMVSGENATVVEYAVSGPCTLEVRPLIAFRDYHGTTHENGAINPAVEEEPGVAICAPYTGLPKLRLAYSAGEIERTGNWYRNFEYDVERERGLDYREDLFNPMVLRLDLVNARHAAVIASIEPHSAAEAALLRSAEVKRRASFRAATDSTANPALAGSPAPLFVRTLVEAADQFIVKRGAGSTIIAGYHWFSDWGRDTMISLPGLTLTTGRYDDARNILLAFAGAVDRGMLPNRFPDAGAAPEYNTVDATLFFFEAVRALVAHTGDYDFVQDRLYPVLADIIDWHERGTRYGIRVDVDGLLMAGEPGVQLTWMDAKVGDRVVTPRYGKPVEVQALWQNALRVMEEFAERFGKPAQRAHYEELANRATASFGAFWNDAAGCLYDVINGQHRDASIRPNQVFAVSLHHSMLPADRAGRVVEALERHLLTPYGLRTLAPSDPQYCGRFEGGPASRDGAYHQGTVWPWLMGPFLTAYLKVHGRSQQALSQAAQWLEELCEFTAGAGLGQVPEVFDGDAPQRSGGCIAQAWSVAELLRCLVENVYEVRLLCGHAASGGFQGV